MHEYDVFFQDDWKVRQGLTLNYGVRWEYRAPPFEVNGIMFVPSDRDFVNHSGTLSSMTCHSVRAGRGRTVSAGD